MAKFGANYGDKSKLCPLCSEHEDSQEMFYKQCSVAKEAVEITSKYEEIFSGNPSKKLICTIKKLTKLREDHQVHSSQKLQDAAEFILYYYLVESVFIDWIEMYI